MSVKGCVSSLTPSLVNASVWVGKLPSAESGEQYRLGGGKGCGEGLLVVGESSCPPLSGRGASAMALGLVPLLLSGVLLSSLCLTFGERLPHSLKPSNRKGHALLHSNFQS